MRKRTYRAVTVKQMDMAQLGVGHDRLILGCDAAKEVWYGAWMNAQVMTGGEPRLEHELPGPCSSGTGRAGRKARAYGRDH